MDSSCGACNQAASVPLSPGPAHWVICVNEARNPCVGGLRRDGDKDRPPALGRVDSHAWDGHTVSQS
jgi:hypothetical protein